MIYAELPAVPELTREEWSGIAEAIQYAADRIYPEAPERRVWLRLRNVALEAAWMRRTRDEFEASGGFALPVLK